MKVLSDKNKTRLQQRITTNALRSLDQENNLIDFSSNDYLGFSKSTSIFEDAHRYLIEHQLKENGATGSRLLSGNHKLYNNVETMLCKFHESEAATIFNSGYDTNIGFFSSVPQRGDIILYDEFIHASIRDGISMSHAKAYKFKHNDLTDLKNSIIRHSELASEAHDSIYVVTESVFSMDGDSPDLLFMSQLCKKYKAYLIVDEAHAIGIFGENGRGQIQQLGIQDIVFARIVTFGKALGSHGAAILGSNELKQYLINFARSLIYTTALPPHALATIQAAYSQLGRSNENGQSKLTKNISFFNGEILKQNLHKQFVESKSAIQSCIISGNNRVKFIAQQLRENGYDIKPILSPSVPEGEERLRFCLHAYNSTDEIREVLSLLRIFVNQKI